MFIFIGMNTYLNTDVIASVELRGDYADRGYYFVLTTKRGERYTVYERDDEVAFRDTYSLINSKVPL